MKYRFKIPVFCVQAYGGRGEIPAGALVCWVGALIAWGEALIGRVASLLAALATIASISFKSSISPLPRLRWRCKLLGASAPTSMAASFCVPDMPCQKCYCGTQSCAYTHIYLHICINTYIHTHTYIPTHKYMQCNIY